jgi:hypothetical protein
MADHTSGPDHWGWKGGRIDLRGYWKILVPERKHLNGARRYEWEHRVVMERHLGRKLGPREHVHHKNGDRKDNRIENLEVLPDTRHHHHYHHSSDPSMWRAPDEPNPEIPCACGCGRTLLKYRPSDGRRRRFICGHHRRGIPSPKRKIRVKFVRRMQWHPSPWGFCRELGQTEVLP